MKAWRVIFTDGTEWTLPGITGWDAISRFGSNLIVRGVEPA